MVSASEIPVKQVVLDANAFINNFPKLQNTTYYTLPDVVNELKDPQSLNTLAHLQNTANLKLITHINPIHVSKITAFSKKTGDFFSLSSADIRVLALTLQLEHDFGSEARLASLRDDPLPPKVYTPKQPIKGFQPAVTVEEAKNEDDDGWEVVKPKKKPILKQEKKSFTSLPGWVDNLDDDDETTGWITPVSEQQEQIFVEVDDVQKVEDGHDQDNVEEERNAGDLQEEEQTENELIESINDLQVKEEPAVKMSKKSKKKKAKAGSVSCMTSDFAMQNVILQMNMNLISTDGKKIGHLKNWVLRCHACYKSTKDMEKKFCPSCGNNALMRTSVGIDHNGNCIYYLQKNFQYNNRGTVYSIPQPKGGRKNNDLLLREDQREYQKKVKQLNYIAKKKEREIAKDESDSPTWLTNWNATVDSGAKKNKRHTSSINTSINGFPLIGHGRRNVNHSKR